MIPTPSRAHARHCTRYRSIGGSFTHRGTTGRNTFSFTGRLRNRKLPAGRYRLKAIATDRAANTSQPKHAEFRILRRR